MLTPKFIRENLDLVKENCRKRYFDFDLKKFQDLEEKRLELIKISEDKKAIRNTVSKEIGLAKQAGSPPPTKKIEDMRELSHEISQHDDELTALMEEMDTLCLGIPNLLADEVPEGKDESSNLLVRQHGEKPSFDFTPLDHVALLEKNDWSDFERAAKITGSRYAILKKEAARLERALVQFLIDQNIQAGYTEFHPPVIINRNSLQNTGQLPKFEADVFGLGKGYEQFYLIPTAEVPLTNLHANEILEMEEFPKLYTAHTPCFRSEAGSAGRDTHGLIRLHQFSKVELVNITRADQSEQAHQDMVAQVEKVLTLLEVPFQVMMLSSGDTGFSAQKCYDIEVWLPGQNAYREISSCSNCGPFQSQRAMIRYKDKQGKIELAHTLNGSCLPIGRTVVALLENHQQADGRVRIPTALAEYYGSDIIGG